MKNEVDESGTILSFEQKGIRRVWHNDQWYFSVVDIISVLTDSPNPRNYWKVLKHRLQKEGSELVTNCNQLKMASADGKKYLTDAANVETLFRLIQSVPSPKAEPIKLWLAKVGYERVKECEDPSIAVERARSLYRKMGRSEEWIHHRISGQDTRNQLTDYWNRHDVNEGVEYAVLTNIIHEEWAGISVKEHKELKGLKQQNLRDHMSDAELIFTALAELSTKKVAERENATGFNENKKAAKDGGVIAKKAREIYEESTGEKVVTGESFLPESQKIKQIKNENEKEKQ